MAISSILCLYANAFYAKEIIKISFAEQLRFLLPIFANSLIMAVVIRLAISLIHGDLLQLIIGGAAGLFYYIGVNFILKSQELEEIVCLVRRNQND